jgi:N-acetylglucosamine kinase-like BadF-type ATPase
VTLRVIKKVWPSLDQVWVGNDLETSMACIDESQYPVKCIVIAGTGSCCYGVYGETKNKIGGNDCLND